MGLLDADDWFKHLFHLSILRPFFVGTQQKPSETLAPMVFLSASDRQVSTLPLQPIKLEMLGELLS